MKLNHLPELPDSGRNHLIVPVGFIKSGSSSLLHYLQEKYPKATVKKLEVLGRSDGEHRFKNFAMPDGFPHMTSIPAAIVRHPLHAAWSQKNYFLYNKKMSIDEFLRSKYQSYRNCIHLADQDRHLEPFKKYDNFMLFRFEDMIKLPDFPHHNDSNTHPEMPEEFKTKFYNLLRENNIKLTYYPEDPNV